MSPPPGAAGGRAGSQTLPQPDENENPTERQLGFCRHFNANDLLLPFPVKLKRMIALHMDQRLLAGNRRLFRSTEQTEAGIVKSPRMLGGVGLKVPLERCSVGIFGNCVSLQDLASAENRTASVPENSRSRACPQRSQ